MLTQAVVKFNANGSNQFEHRRQNDDVLTKMVAPPKNNLRTITLHKIAPLLKLVLAWDSNWNDAIDVGDGYFYWKDAGTSKLSCRSAKQIIKITACHPLTLIFSCDSRL